MPHFAIICQDKADSLDVRLANRPTHVEYLKALGPKLLMAGPFLAEDGQTMIGSLVVVDMADRAEVDAWLADEPYAKAGLFECVTVRPYKRVLP
jgi:uncharacterized protein YciI